MNPTLDRFITEFYAIRKTGERSASLNPDDWYALRKSIEPQWYSWFNEDQHGMQFMGVRIIVDRKARSLQLPH